MRKFGRRPGLCQRAARHRDRHPGITVTPTARHLINPAPFSPPAFSGGGRGISRLGALGDNERGETRIELNLVARVQLHRAC
jgi:hypothetical protein